MKSDLVYLKHIRDSIRAIKGFVKDIDFEMFETDLKTQSAVIRQVEVIGEAASKLSQKTRDLESSIPWREVIATRNKLIHEYFGVDIRAIWGIIEMDLLDLEKGIDSLIERQED